VKELKWFSTILIDKYLERENLFQDLGDGVSIPLPYHIQKQLDDTFSFFEEDKNKDEMKSHLTNLQTIANVFMEKNIQKMVRHSTEKPMIAIFRLKKTMIF